jgi:ribosomal protein S18 acetylase RimI-like enzyme
MIIKKQDEETLKRDFLPMIIDLWCGDKFIPNNSQHVEWLNKKIHASFEDFGTALCVYTDDGEAIGFLWYKHDSGMQGVSFSGKDAHIIQMGLYEKFQRQGIGTKLLEEACANIRANGGECLYTDTYAANWDSMVFYIKRSFIPVALLPGLDGMNSMGQVFLYRIL